MTKRFLLAWLVVFILWISGSFVTHHMLLLVDYSAVQSLFRTPGEARPLFPLMILAHAIMAGALVWIYSRGVEGRSWVGQGLRFGIAAALLTVVPWYMIYYVVQPMVGLTVIKQIVSGGVLVIVLSLVTAFLYRRPRS